MPKDCKGNNKYVAEFEGAATDAGFCVSRGSKTTVECVRPHPIANFSFNATKIKTAADLRNLYGTHKSYGIVPPPDTLAR